MNETSTDQRSRLVTRVPGNLSELVALGNGHLANPLHRQSHRDGVSLYTWPIAAS